MLALLLTTVVSANGAPRNVTCGGVVGIDHAYGDVSPGYYLRNVSTTAECCAACQKEPRCVAWVLETDLNYCFLKAATSSAACSNVKTGLPCTREHPSRISMQNCPIGPSPPSPAPPPSHFLPNFYNLSNGYRNWSYYIGPFDGFVVPPLAGNFSGQSLTDTPLVYEKTPEDTLGGGYRMTYLFFNNTKPNNGYETALALSDDLLRWTFNPPVGHDNGIIFTRSDDPTAYDYGGVTIGGMHWSDMEIRTRRTLKKDAATGKYHTLYGCYPSRAGYESGDGGSGIAQSDDGIVWSRVSTSTPIISGGRRTPAAPAWEAGVVYQPNLVESNGTFYDFYNAAGTNAGGSRAEETGVAMLSTGLPGVGESKSEWVEYAGNPVIKSGTSPVSPDTDMASDPKVFYDAELSLWVMFYVCLGASTHGHADTCIAFSRDLLAWDKDERPLFKAGGHPSGIDADHAHKVSVIYDAEGVGYMYYTAVSGGNRRGIALLTSVNKN